MKDYVTSRWESQKEQWVDQFINQPDSSIALLTTILRYILLWWILLTLGLFLLSVWWETNLEVEQAVAKAPQTREQIIDVHPVYGDLILTVQHPKRLPIKLSDQTSSSFAISLSYMGIITTPLSIDQVLTTTYQVSIEDHGHLAFFDPNNHSATPEFTFLFNKGPQQSTILYAQPITPRWRSSDLQIEVMVAKDGVMQPNPLRVSMTTETLVEAYWRHFRAAIIRHTTGLIFALTTALAGFVLQVWSELKESIKERERLRKRRRREEKEIQDDRDKFHLLAEYESPELAHQYLLLKERIRHAQYLEHIQEEIDKRWNQSAPIELRQFIELVEADKQSRESLLATTEEMTKEDVQHSLEWVLDNHVDVELQQRACDLIAILSQDPASEIQFSTDLNDRILYPMWYSLLRTVPSLFLWRSEQPLIDDHMKKILQDNGFQRNTFAASSAERDRFFFTQPTPTAARAKLSTIEHTLIIGEKGSGKTASALLLAYDYLKNAKKNAKGFPVYWTPDVKTYKKDALLQSLAVAVSQALLGYITVHPRQYLTDKIEHQSAIAYLIARTYGTGNDLSMALRRYGLPMTPQSAILLDRIYMLTEGLRMEELADTQWLNLICSAHPSEFPRLVICADFQDTHLERAYEAKRSEITDFFNTLDTFMIDLLDTNVMLKFFLPMLPSIKEQDWPIQTMTLNWTDEELAQLLEERIEGMNEYDSTLDIFCNPSVSHRDIEHILNSIPKTPAAFIEVGNQFVKHFVEKMSAEGKPLSFSDVEKIRKKYLQTEKKE